MSNNFNKFSEAKILTGHDDIVRLIAIIDKERFCSGGDDGLVIIWKLQTGEQLHRITAHTRRITGICTAFPSLEREKRSQKSELVLITASSDKTIKIWNVDSGNLVKTFEDHKSTVKCVVVLSCLGRDVFCTGGERLCLWSITQGLLCSESSPTGDVIHLLCVLESNVIASASDKHLVLYRCIEDQCGSQWRLEVMRYADIHRESVLDLISINDDYFASGDLDGCIAVCCSRDQKPLLTFNRVFNDEGDNRDYPMSVHCLASVDKKFIVSGKGSGFMVYDIDNKNSIIDMPNIHESNLRGITVAHDSRLLVTSSEYGSIKLWGFTKTIHETFENTLNDSDLTQQPAVDLSHKILLDLGKCFKELSCGTEQGLTKNIELIGECNVHSGPVNSCQTAPGGRLISCGADNLVIIWQSRAIDVSKQDKLLRDALFNLTKGPS